MSNHCVQVFTSENHNDYIQTHKDSVNSLIANALENGFEKLASNFITDEIAISFGATSLLGTVNENEYDNSPICSPFNLFCLYPKKKIQSIKVNWLRHFLNVVTTLFTLTFKTTKFDRVIQLNNKPCDAIVYPELSPTEVESCVTQLKKQFPNHAIIFPRIDRLTSPTLVESLEANGFLMVPTRNVHIFHPENSYMKRSHTKRDFSLLKKQDFQFVEHDDISGNDLLRIYELYKMLFLEKHGRENPELTIEFFQKSHAHRWYTFFALRNPKGVIDAFLSYETHGNNMACGPLGYDTSQDKEVGLYRMIFAHSLKIADQHNYIFNFGGGNEHFKQNRGSRREIGYTAVYCKHLPLYRRFPWMLLETVGRKATIKILEKVTF